tara:strand:+ start:626 stop:1393 length:768 start_codon:yes stop_codon:yes gene_type:complete
MLSKIIGFLLKKFPRPFLQRISKPIFLIIRLFYLGDKVLCPICKKKFDKFLPYGRKIRKNALCPNCLSLERHRLLYLFLERKTNIFKKDIKLLHIAPEQCLINVFSNSKNIDYVSGDLFSPLAKIKMDIHKMPFQNNSFDIILCNHVLEHVEDDKKAIKEINRVMKKDGFSILQVPFYYPIPQKTIEDKSILSEKEREKVYGQSDHLRKYGKDYDKRILSQGLKVKKSNFINSFSKKEKNYFGLQEKEIIYYCYK